MIKIKSNQVNTTSEKHFVGPNIATPKEHRRESHTAFQSQTAYIARKHVW
jgi:hypothetical protein